MYERNTGLTIPADNAETLYSAGHQAWRLIEHPNYLQVQDPTLGEYAISGRPEADLMRELVVSPLALRSMDIAQLSKLERHGTIPNLSSFKTLGHVMANAEIVVRKAGEHPGSATKEQILSWQLAVMLDDLPHGIGRHITDMIIEGGFGGAENAHQLRTMEAWRYGGVLDILERHRVQVTEAGGIKGIITPPWVETSAPDICVERVQYTIEEMRLWLESADMGDDAREIIERLCNLDNYIITDDGRMAVKDPETALLFAKAYLLLTTEHWNEPVHRVIEHLLIEAFKHSVYSRRLPGMNEYDNGTTADVVSYTYGVDHDLQHALTTSRNDRDDFMFAISQLLSQVGKEERWRYKEYKKQQYVRFMLDPRAEDYPSPHLNGHMIDFGPPSSAVEIEVTPGVVGSERPAIKANAAELIHTDGNGVQYGLQPMKNRYVDPLTITKDGYAPLSEVNPRYKELLRQHAAIQASKTVVRLAVSSGYEELVKEVVQRNSNEATRPRRQLKRDQLRWQIEAASKRAVSVARASGQLVLMAA